MSDGTEGTCAGAQEDHFVCKDCGPHTKADEDGCCAYCGRDCTVEPCRLSQRGLSSPIELNADEAERFAKMLDDDSPPGPALRALFAKAEPEAKATTCQRCGAAAAYDGAVYCGAACCALSEDGR